MNTIRPEKFRRFLQDELVKRCRDNSAYSLRAFARDLEIDNSILSKLLSGKRPLGQKVISKLMLKLDLSGRQLSQLLKDENDKDFQFEKINLDHFEVISDWHHYAILELLSIDGFQSDIKWIAKALGMKVVECEAAVERLKRVELIEESEDGILIDVSGGKTTNISEEMNHIALRKMQKQLLIKSIESIDEVAYKKRNNTSITIAIDTDRLGEAIDEITKFRRNMAKLLSKGKKKNEVYNLSIALCPLSRINQENLI